MKNNQIPGHIKEEDSQLETERLRLLAAFYKKDYSLARTLFCQIFDYARKYQNLNENELKCLSQIQTSYKKLKPVPAEHEFSALEKCHSALSHLIAQNVKKEIHNVQNITMDQWEQTAGLSKLQERLVFKTLMTFQLTTGCSNFCRRCNEWALPGTRKHFSFSAVKKIMFQMIEQQNFEISLFGASDPLDWYDHDNTLLDIVKLIKQTPIEYSLLTKVPKGKDGLLKKLIHSQANLSVSVTAKNSKRIQRIQDEIHQPLSKQHETDDLLIPAGLDEDFSSVKPSITDGYGTEITPDGAFIIIPTFTSALYPFGHKKIRVTPEVSFFPLKKTGRHALLVDYFKPLKGYDLKQNACCLSYLLDAQVESIILDTGEDDLTPPGMRSIKEYLSIFEEKARLQRKKMTLSVMRRLKKHFLEHSDFKHLPTTERDIYLKKIKSHLNLCRKKECELAKIHTLSFFLNAITTYLEKNSFKVKILRELLNNEITQSKSTFSQIDILKQDKLFFSLPEAETFNTFRWIIQLLIGMPDIAADKKETVDQAVREFIKQYPAMYDPVTDLFVQAKIQT